MPACRLNFHHAGMRPQGNDAIWTTESSREREWIHDRWPLLRPAAGLDPAPLDAGPLDCVDPGDLSGTVNRDQHQQAAIEAVTARTEALETVDWRQAGIGVVEGEQLPVHGAPGALCGTFGDRSGGMGAT